MLIIKNGRIIQNDTPQNIYNKPCNRFIAEFVGETNKIEAKIHYPVPLNKQKAARHLKLNQKNFTKVNEQAKKIITLPIHQYLSKKHISYIAQKIKSFYEKNNTKYI